MNHRRRLFGLAACSLALATSSCTFGVLKTTACLDNYRQGMIGAAAQAAASGPVTRESYGFCLDGRRRAEAMLATLRAHGFETRGPSKHFEVPGGWCLDASRPVEANRFEPMQSLATVCSVGHAARGFMTGGTLTASDGARYQILSDLDRKAREDLERRLTNGG